MNKNKTSVKRKIIQKNMKNNKKNNMKNNKKNNMKNKKPIIKKNIMSSSLKTIYNKLESKKHDDIKKRKTVKRNKNIFLNKKKTKKKIHSGSGILGGLFGSKVKKMLNSYKASGDEIRKELLNYNDEFKIIFNLYKKKQDILNKYYINKFNIEINSFLNGIIERGLEVNVIDKKNKEGYKLMKKRMEMLNKIYRFSTAVGQTLGSYKSKAITIKGIDFNISLNQPKNFYYKHRHRRATRFVKYKGVSKIERNFSTSGSIWGQIAVYREYEMKLEKIKSEIKNLLVKHSRETKEIIRRVKEEKTGKSEKSKGEGTSVKENEDVNLITKEELDKLKELKVLLKPTYDKYNENLKTPIHYYVPKVKITNMNLILMKMPRKSKFAFGNLKNIINPYKTNIEVDEQKVYDTSDNKIVKSHKEGNKVLFEKSVDLIDIFFNDTKKILDNNKFNYMSSFVKFHGLHKLFHNIGILYLYNIEKKSYIDIGQISMLSYENHIDASLLDIKNKDKLIYSENMDYYNNILHLPRFILNHLNACMIKSAEETYNDDYYTLVGVKDSNQIGNIDDTRLTKIMESIGINKFKMNTLGLKKEKVGAESEKELEQLKDEDFSLNTPDDETDDNNSDDKKSIFLPISTYHAMFKIRDFNSIRNIKFKKDYFTTKVKINNENIKKGEAISRLFYINNNNDILPGTIIYLYKQIAYLLHFTLCLTHSNDNVLYSCFLEKILNFAYGDATEEKYDKNDNKIVIDKNKSIIGKRITSDTTIITPEERNTRAKTQLYKEKNIKRNIGIFSGIDNRALYVTYAMIVYLQHLNRLLECVTDLEYLTDKLFHTYKKDTGARNIFRDEIDRISKHEDYSVDSEKATGDNKSYGYDDKLLNNEVDKDIKSSSYDYKRLIYKVKKEIDRTKTLEEINSLIQAIVKQKQKTGIKPRLTLSNYYELTRKGDKLDLENTIYKLYLDDDTVKEIDRVYFKTDLIEKHLFLNPNSEVIGGHSSEFLKGILNRDKEQQPEKIKQIQAELYYLLLLVMDKHIKNSDDAANNDVDIPNFMNSIKKLNPNAINDIEKMIKYYIRTHIKIQGKDKDKAKPLKDIYTTISKGEDTISKGKEDMMDSKMMLMNEFNLLHKDNFIFFTDKMYRDKEFLLSSIKGSLPSYEKEYPHTTQLKKTIDVCNELLTSMKDKDKKIKNIVLGVIKDNIISSSKFLLVNYDHEKKPNIVFTTKNDPITKLEINFIKLWSKQKEYPFNKDTIIHNKENDLKREDSTIAYIEKEGLDENKLDSIPEIILGHTAFKKKILEYKKSELDTLLKERNKDIENFNKNIILVSLFKKLINKLLQIDVGSSSKQKLGEHSSVEAFHNRSDIYYPMQFVFLDSSKPYEKEKGNYLQYRTEDKDFKDSDKIETTLKVILDDILEKYKNKDKKDKGETQQSIEAEKTEMGVYEAVTGRETFRKSENEHFKNIKNNILDKIKKERIFFDLYDMKEKLDELKNLIKEYKEKSTTLKSSQKEDRIDNIIKRKTELNKFYKLKLKPTTTYSGMNEDKDIYEMKETKEENEDDFDKKHEKILNFDFETIVKGYSKISISLDTLTKEEKYNEIFVINKYNDSFFKSLNDKKFESNEISNIKGPEIEIDSDKSGTLIKKLKELYKNYIDIAISEVTTYYQNITSPYRWLYKGIRFGALEDSSKKRVHDLILIIINGYLTNDTYVKEQRCNIFGKCDSDISRQTFIPAFINQLKNKSVNDFKESKNVILTDLKDKIKDVAEKNDISKLSDSFNENVDDLITQILTKIKDNFILVDRNTLEKAGKSKE